MSDKPLFLMVDGSSYLYRAFHALPPLTNASGEPTGAVYGVLNMLNKLLEEYDTRNVVVVFDASGKTFRDDLYKKYKAQRPPMPDDLRQQVRPLHDVITALGLPILQIKGVEADDVIGTLAVQAQGEGYRTVVSTIDKDMAQLVNGHITMVNTMSGSSLDIEGVKKKFGVTPTQMIDYLALVGDTSDNIPGVAGVGQKGASAMLGTFDSLEGIYNNLENLAESKIRGAARIAGKLEEQREAAFLSRELATIRCDVELEQSPATLLRQPPDTARLRTLYTDLQFGSLLRRLPESSDEARPSDTSSKDSDTPESETATASEQPSAEYSTVFEQAALAQWLERARDARLLAIDIHTHRGHYREARIVGVGLAVTPGEATYIPLAHVYAGAPEQLAADDVLAQLAPLLEDETCLKAGHNLKRQAHALANHNITLRGANLDCMLQSYVLNSTANRHELTADALTYLHTEAQNYESIAGKGAKQLDFPELAVEQASDYVAQRADFALRLGQTLQQKLQETGTLGALYSELEQPLVPVLQRMEYRGVLIDEQMLAEHSSEIAQTLATLQAQAFEEAGSQFNLGSPKQLQEILFGTLGLPVKRKTAKGQPSTAEDVLEELAEEYLLPQLILQHRSLAKLRSTYTENLPKQVCASTGRVHTSYHQAVAATGRLSSSEPNLQNIPIRTGEGRRIRQAFVPPPGYVLLAADYSQIELRIMAHLSNDESLLTAFNEDRDIHQATAAEVFDVPLAEVSQDQRRSAKAINFGLIYGMSAFGLARQLGIGRHEAQAYVDLYFERYPGVASFMDRTREQARERGYVETVSGRRLYLPEIKSRNYQRRQYAERSAINAPMQGTAADIIKQAMIDVDAWLTSEQPDAHLIMQVHDELVLEVHESQIKPISAALTDIMTGAATLKVPLKVDSGVGANWDEAH